MMEDDMCIICTGLDNSTLLPWEAVRNSTEIWNTIREDHKEELTKKITEAVEEWLNNNNKKGE